MRTTIKCKSCKREFPDEFIIKGVCEHCLEHYQEYKAEILCDDLTIRGEE
jgi:hypothetical protein